LLGDVILITIILDMASAYRIPFIPARALNTLAKLGTATTTLAIISQSWSKTSFAITLLRISEGRIRYFLWFAIATINVLFALGALFPWIACNPREKAWEPRLAGTCWDPSFNIVFGIIVSGTSAPPSSWPAR
jgi:hypothetical protein